MNRLINSSTLWLVSISLLTGACKPGDPPPNQVASQPAVQVWDKTFGGDQADELRKLIATPDGGFLLAGSSNSNASGDKTQGKNGFNFDFWVVKINKDGTKQWDQTIGISTGSGVQSAIATPDGGFLLGGATDVNVASGQGKGSRDYWVVKLSADGTKEWDKIYGTPGWEDHLYSMVATPDGGFLLGGNSQSNASGDKTQDNRGEWSSSDFWVIKLSGDGTKQWDKTLGGNRSEELVSIVNMPDGGFVLGGWSASNASADKSQDSRGSIDYWIVKINSEGTKVWDKTLGGNGIDFLSSMVTTSDGGLLLAGYSESKVSGEKTQITQGYNDYWVVKLTADGAKEWDKVYANSDKYISRPDVYITATSDGGFLLGYTPTPVGPTYSDYYIARCNKEGGKEWDKIIGGDGWDELASISTMADGGFLLGGTSGSNTSGDKTQNSRGYLDYWIVKIK